MRTAILFLFLAALASFNAPSSFACEAAGANTHIGVVTVVDLPRRTFTLKDAETAKPIVFVATTEQLKGVKVDDEIAVTYVTDRNQLRATSIKRN
jgi:hypothetical protein